MAKYIVEVKDGETLYKAVIAPDGEPYITPAMGNVYTEPDLEQVRKEAYDKGYDDATAEIGSDEQAIAEKAYQKGLSDGKNQDAKDFADMYDSGYSEGLKVAWDAVRKIGYSLKSSIVEEIFGTPYSSQIFSGYSASEVIEKIRQYEQEKEELGIQGYFKKGEEVIDADGTKAVVLNVSEDNYCQVYTKNGCIENWHIHTYKFHKTGRTFPEIVSVLEKMREGQEQ